MGFRRPEVQILSPRPSSEQGLHRLLRLFLQKSSRAHAAALPLSGRPSKKAALPCRAGPAARLFSFFSFSFGKASWEEGGGGPILSLPFPFDPLSRKRTENGPPGSSACRRDRRPGRAGGRGAGQIGRGRRRPGRRADRQGRRRRDKRGSVDGYKRAGRKSPPGSCAGFRRCRTPKRVPARQASGPGAAAQVAGRKGCKRAGRKSPPGSCAGWNAATGRQSARRWQAAGSRGRARAGISRWAQAARGRAGGGPRRGCTWNRSKASKWGTAS